MTKGMVMRNTRKRGRGGAFTLVELLVVSCPNYVEPRENHTYILNKYLAVNTLNTVKLSGRVRDKDGNGRSDSYVVLMGEKRASEPDYFMEADPASEFDRVVDPYKHG